MWAPARSADLCTGVGWGGFGLVAFSFLLVGAFASLLAGEAIMLRSQKKGFPGQI